jgi:iron complex transport system ATP-binding protein
MLQLQQLTLGFEPTRHLIQHVQATATAGDCIALFGLNGTGKSTLLRTIAALQLPQSGQVLLNGTDVNAIGAKQRASQIAMVLTDRIDADYLNVRDAIALGRIPFLDWTASLKPEDNRVISEVIVKLSLQPFEQRFIQSLSDGERQRVMIGRALAQEAGLILMDEPTAFLDYRNKEAIFRLMKQIAEDMRKVVLISTHDLEYALQHCNRFWIIQQQQFFDTRDSAEARKILMAV